MERYETLAWRGKWVRDTVVHYVDRRKDSHTMCGLTTQKRDGWNRQDYEGFWSTHPAHNNVCRACREYYRLSFLTRTARRLKQWEQLDAETTKNV